MTDEKKLLETIQVTADRAASVAARRVSLDMLAALAREVRASGYTEGKQAAAAEERLEAVSEKLKESRAKLADVESRWSVDRDQMVDQIEGLTHAVGLLADKLDRASEWIEGARSMLKNDDAYALDVKYPIEDEDDEDQAIEDTEQQRQDEREIADAIECCKEDLPF